MGSEMCIRDSVHAEDGNTTTEMLEIVVPEEVQPQEPATRNDEVREMLSEKSRESTVVSTLPSPQTRLDLAIENNPALQVASSHGKTAKRIIENTWDLKILDEMCRREFEGKKRPKVLEHIHAQTDIVRQAAKEDDEPVVVEAEVVEAEVAPNDDIIEVEL